MELVINEFLSNADVPIILKQVEKFLSGKALYGLLAEINISMKSYDELFIDMGSICLKSYLKSLIMENYMRIFPLLSKQAHSDFQLLIKYFRQYQNYLRQNETPNISREMRLKISPYLFNESANSYFVFYLFSIVCNISKNFNVVNLYLDDASWIPIQKQQNDEEDDGIVSRYQEFHNYENSNHNYKKQPHNEQKQHHNDIQTNNPDYMQESTYLAPILLDTQGNVQQSVPTCQTVVAGIPFLPNPKIPLLQAELDSLKIHNETLAQQLQTVNSKQVLESQNAEKEIAKLKKQLSVMETQYKQCLNDKNNASLYKERLERASREQQQLISTNEELRKSVQTLKTKLSEVVDTAKSARLEANALQKENSELKSKNVTLQTKLDRALADNTGQEKIEAVMDRELSRFKTQVLEAQRKVQEIKNELESMTDKYNTLESKYNANQTSLKNANDQLKEKQQQITELLSEKAQLKNNLQKIMATDEQVQQLRSELQIANVELQRQTEAARNAEVLRTRLEDIQVVKIEQKAQIDRLLNELQKTQQIDLDNKKLQIEIQRLNDAMSEKEKRISELNEISTQQLDDLRQMEELKRNLAQVQEARDEIANEAKLYAQRNAYLTQRVHIIQAQFNKLRGLDAGITDINSTIQQYALPGEQNIQFQGQLNVIK